MHDNLREYLLVKEAADILGVSPSTVRNWERAGKISAHRNPMNGYRLFRRSELERILSEIGASAAQSSDTASKTGRGRRRDEEGTDQLGT